jgi:hypothetical protein
MYQLTQTRNTNSSRRNPQSVSFLRRGYLLIGLVLTAACLALVPRARAACQEGCDTRQSTFLGTDALVNNTSGSEDTAVGADALRNNTAGIGNTAIGESTLASNSSGNDNTAIGVLALFSNTLGNHNTASGDYALYSNTSGDDNTADGHFALFHNTTGPRNTATGHGALYGNTTGEANTANGYAALGRTTTGGANTAMGAHALARNVTGSGNTATGNFALNNAVSGASNTACGTASLPNNTTGSNNIALGYSAGLNLTTGNNDIAIGSDGVAGESNTIRLGRQGTQTDTYIAGISGTTVAGGVGVIIDSSGHIGTVVSSEHFKDAIKPMDKASEAILSLQPVTFRYKHDLDPKGIPQFGLVAEQVAKINPDLVARDEQGRPYSVRYEAVNAMLLNEFLKEHRKVEEQANFNQQQEAINRQLKSTIAEEQEEIRTLTAALKKQAAQIQKVSAQVEVNQAARRLAENRVGD